jgi:single-strand DNA-binding protein
MLIGNLGKDPEIRSTSDGREVANLVLATNESWTDKNSGERKDRTEWHRVVCFNPGLVNVIKNYLRKGSKIFIEGQLQTRKWQDQQGQERYSTEVILQGYNCNLTMLDRSGGGGERAGGDSGSFGGDRGGSYGGAPQGGGYSQQPSSQPAGGSIQDGINDDIPF